MRSALARHAFLLGLAIAVAAAIAAPDLGRRLREEDRLLPLLVAATLFTLGMTLDLSRARREGVAIRGLAAGLAATYADAPLAGYVLARLLGPPLDGPTSDGHRFLEAVMLAASQAGTLASAPALTAIAGGDQALALALTLSSNVLTVIVTPLLLELSLGVLVAFPAAKMTWRMTVIILAPVALGQGLRLVAGERIRVLMPLLRRLPPLSILVFVFIGFSAAGDRLTAEPGLALRFLMVSALLHAALLAFTVVASRWLGLSAEQTAAVAFCGSQKTLPNGIYLWDRFFPANPHGAVPLVQYHLLQLVLDSLIAPRLQTARRRSVRRAEVDDLVGGGA